MGLRRMGGHISFGFGMFGEGKYMSGDIVIEDESGMEVRYVEVRNIWYMIPTIISLVQNKSTERQLKRGGVFN